MAGENGEHLRYWQDRLSAIYPNADKSPDYMMAHVYTACADLGRLLLRGRTDNRRDTSVIAIISWLMGISTHFKIDFEQAILARFPGVCPYCIKNPCACDKTDKRALHYNGRPFTEFERIEEVKAKYSSFTNVGKRVTWSWLITDLSNIYPSNRALLLKGGQAYVVGKMLEEGGELHRAYSAFLSKKGDILAIQTELADLTAWVVSCWDLNGSGKDLEAEFIDTYRLGCPRCRQLKCTCETYSITRGEEDLLKDIISQLSKLEGAGVGGRIYEALRLTDQIARGAEGKSKDDLISKLNELMVAPELTEASSQQVKGAIADLAAATTMFKDWAEGNGSSIDT